MRRRALEEVDRLKQLLAENKQASKGKEVSSAEHSRVMAELKKLVS